jgi:hypothetical protein
MYQRPCECRSGFFPRGNRFAQVAADDNDGFSDSIVDSLVVRVGEVLNETKAGFMASSGLTCCALWRPKFLPADRFDID